MNTNEEITDWLNRQHAWIQEAAYRLLQRGKLEETDINDLVDRIKNPNPSSAGARSYPAIGGGTATSQKLRIESIGPVVGIDALNPRNPLKFGPGNLTVVYGTNGSGKSGYTRIISKACGKPHSVELKPNVYQGAPAKQECTFFYTIGGTSETKAWTANSDPIEDLKAVDVFDTECGRIYLEKETELSYEPPELTLFTYLVDACEQVKAQLEREREKLVSTLPDIPSQHVGSVAGKAYSALTKDTTEVQIRELVTWSEADEKTLTELQERLRIGDLGLAAKNKRAEKGQIEQVRTALLAGVDAVGKEALDELRLLKESAKTKRKAAEEGAKAMGDASKLEGVGSETWKAMWEAARTYSTTEAYQEKEFPQTGEVARCVLCHQDLDEAAKNRLRGFEDFVKGTLETEAVEAEKKWKEALESVPVRPVEESVATSCQAAELSDDLRDAVERAWQELERSLSPIRSGTIPDEPPPIGQVHQELLLTLEDLSSKAETKAKEFDDLARDPDRTADNQRIVEIEGKKWVAEQAAAVREEIARLKNLAEYDEWKRQTSTTGISRKAGELSEELITEAYVQRFNEELKRLGAQKIQVELAKSRTSQARSKHRIRLKDAEVDGTGPAEVLSEGERRIVALAAFLADVMGRDSKSPFVFDDPISSLDQIFEEKVIARLVELSRDRQVLVFTHRLSFLGLVADKGGKDFHCVNIERQPWGTGDPGGVPIYGKGTIGALQNLKNDSLSKARKALANEGNDAYQFHAQKLCSDFRKVIERVVENVFLAGVIQRHSREVHTKNVVSKLLRINREDCDFIDKMMTEFSKHEHSQSLESPVALPEPEALEAYLDRMIEWHKEFEKRKT
ncbi:MAG: AAA family ATPase [Verrucomicrobiales bacterium]